MLSVVSRFAGLALLVLMPARASFAQCVDYGHPVEPVGSIVLPSTSYDISISANYAYVANGLSFRVVDISNPAAPILVGSVDNRNWAIDLAISGNYAYVADGNSGLQVIDISVPSSPVIVSSVDTPGQASGVAVSGGHAYVVETQGRMHIVDIAVPEAPSMVGSVDTPGRSEGVAVSGNYAYVADANRLQIVDVTAPASPAIVAAVDFPAVGVTIVGNLAYIAGNVAGLGILDVSTPTSPVLLGSFDLPGFARWVAIDGNLAYVSARLSGLWVMDVTVPTSPNVVGVLESSDFTGVAISGDHVYVGEGSFDEGGVWVLPKQCPTPPVSVLITNFEATAHDGKVQIRWDVWSDESLESIVLYRSERDRRPVAIMRSAFDPITRTYVDENVTPGTAYQYELVIVTQSGGQIRSPAASVTVPALANALGQNHPNPFNPSTSIEYTLNERRPAALSIFDARGRLVAQLDQGAPDVGSHRVEWNGRDASGNPVASGVYFYRLDGFAELGIRKMVLLK